MERWIWKAMLQAFWSRGYDLRQGALYGWLTEANRAGQHPQWLWNHWDSLPYRDPWPFQEPVNTPQIIHLSDVRTYPPDFTSFVTRSLEGAEYGMRTILQIWGWRECHPATTALLIVRTHWARELQLPEMVDVVVHPVDVLIRRYGYTALTFNPFSESTAVLSSAILAGLTWPGQPDRTHRALVPWNDFYRGEAWPAAQWVASTMSNLPWRTLDHSVLETWHDLPHDSQVYAMCDVAHQFYALGKSHDEWVKRLWRCAYYYPFDHPAPNLAIIISTLYRHQNWNETMQRIHEAGYDALGNAMVVGAVLGAGSEPVSSRSSIDLSEPLRNSLARLTKDVIARAHVARAQW